MKITEPEAVKFLNDFLDYASFYWKLQLCMTKYTGYGNSANDADIDALIADFAEQYAESAESAVNNTPIFISRL